MSQSIVAPERSSDHKLLVGVRMPGESDVIFCGAGDVECAIGEWVLLAGPSREYPARVVIVTGHWHGSVVSSTWRVLRSMRSEEVAGFASNSEVAQPFPAGPEIGAIGPVPAEKPKGMDTDIPGPSLSREDERFRRLKRTLPKLGQTVTTDHGDAMVIAIDVFRRSLTCAMASDGSEIVIPADALIPPQPNSRS